MERFKFGSVGMPLPGVDVKIARDGEVLIRGKHVMRGYWKNESATSDIIDQDGWFHSGDIGVFDDHGFLTITDRKKDIIVTAGGKNVAPQNIENLLKQSPWISQAMVHGDKRPYLVALVTLNPDAMARFAEETGRPNDIAQLAADTEVRARVELEITATNRRLSQFETIKKFHILAADFSIEGGELTPTLKVKRKVVSERHKRALDALYDED
jgi:long-chain acyl-CoA synthetase